MAYLRARACGLLGRGRVAGSRRKVVLLLLLLISFPELLCLSRPSERDFSQDRAASFNHGPCEGPWQHSAL